VGPGLPEDVGGVVDFVDLGGAIWVHILHILGRKSHRGGDERE
jgi:hypothetical protein